ncbi:hypothetical protein QP110_02910 [Aerococcus sp. UMB10185]|uniref:hypothetical protein n=1 Tax=unclassified Aerococcus TaxID=2618060 RepID=UPI0008A208E7|nr:MULTISPECIES: hypothetical protein [unclassified Aerococcus]KAB0647324.1 hypothetical protein F6I01_02905 [Aerococcus sanguinicola]MDK6233213.1 hypothetical protein [Aerococcus sp. UMB10185]OHO44999.1 hypothetical protein HMPREF2705_05810 [Aerococcus sp. HMSC035B07]MDK8502349.1 hypothetical protein [Aerococcus sp. UMB1112A]OFN00272.1 hypothetical protein HMPREF2626_09320 [Aerococcus sp. HMSC062A02]
MSAIKRALVSGFLVLLTALPTVFAEEVEDQAADQGRPEDFPSLEMDRPSMEEEVGFVPQEEESQEDDLPPTQAPEAPTAEPPASEPSDDLELAQPDKAPLVPRRSVIWSRALDQEDQEEDPLPSPKQAKLPKIEAEVDHPELPKVGASSKKFQVGLWALLTAFVLFLVSCLEDYI